VNTYKTLLLEREEKIVKMALNVPKTLNACTDQMFKDVILAFEEISLDDSIRVVIVTGMGKAFSAGADLKGRLIPWSERLLKDRQAFSERRIEDRAPQLMKRMTQILIASVNGPALGWGNCLAVACDLRIASDKATFAPLFAKMGLVPGWGSTYNLPKLIGLGRSLELTLSGRIIDAQEALAIGLVERVVPHADLESATMELAQHIANSPPLAIEWVKRLYNCGVRNDLESQLVMERLGRACHGTEDALEATKAFVEKREPVFKGDSSMIYRGETILE